MHRYAIGSDSEALGLQGVLLMSNAIVGWAASIILFLTVIAQVVKQWRKGSNEGVSRLLFVGQLAASIGFLAYSIMTGEPVFAVTNSFLALANALGIFIYWKNATEE